jgi:hypothetical protein
LTDVARTDGRPVWRVRIRYEQAFPAPLEERLAESRWVEQALPAEAGPSVALPLVSGMIVALHVRASTKVDAVTAAVEAVEEVVGDSRRVLGEVLSTRVLRLAPPDR